MCREFCLLWGQFIAHSFSLSVFFIFVHFFKWFLCTTAVYILTSALMKFISADPLFSGGKKSWNYIILSKKKKKRISYKSIMIISLVYNKKKISYYWNYIHWPDCSETWGTIIIKAASANVKKKKEKTKPDLVLIKLTNYHD